MTHHDLELSLLKDRLIAMAGLTERALTRAIQALVERDETLAQGVKSSDDEIDRIEVEIDEIAVSLLAKAPLARDLRFIIVAMKIAHDLERAGDEASGVAKQAVKLNLEPQLKSYVDIPRMAEMALAMLRDAIDGFVSGDTVKVRAVLPRDAEVDSIYKQLQRELVSYMIESPPTITRCLSLMQVAKRIERIADHAKNIAEETVFLQEGTDIRHQKALQSLT